jgi:hypothetical protein
LHRGRLRLLVCGCILLYNGSSRCSGGGLLGRYVGECRRLRSNLAASRGGIFIWLTGKQRRESLLFAANTTVLVLFVLIASGGCH